MAVIIKRRKGENLSAFLNRASRVINRSGILLEARKRRFYATRPNKRSEKLSALHRLKVLNEIERKRKLGLV